MAKGEPSLDLELYKAQLVVAHADKEKKASKAGSKKKSNRVAEVRFSPVL
jgi:hypothetical protein